MIEGVLSILEGSRGWESLDNFMSLPSLCILRQAGPKEEREFMKR